MMTSDDAPVTTAIMNRRICSAPRNGIVDPRLGRPAGGQGVDPCAVVARDDDARQVADHG
jgi:hypothetical protein